MKFHFFLTSRWLLRLVIACFIVALLFVHCCSFSIVFYYRTQPNNWLTYWWIVGFIATLHSSLFHFFHIVIIFLCKIDYCTSHATTTTMMTTTRMTGQGQMHGQDNKHEQFHTIHQLLVVATTSNKITTRTTL